MKKRILSALLTFCMVLTLLPVSALAAETEPAPGDVAYVAELAQVSGADVYYTSLDTAIQAVSGNSLTSATIELLADATSDGMDIRNITLTIQGKEGTKPTVTFAKEGIHAVNSQITFKDCTVDMDVSENPSRNGGTANLIDDSDLTFINTDVSIVNDKADDGGESAIYLYQGSNLYIQDGSHMTISGFNNTNQDSGIFADGSERDDNLPHFQIVVSGTSTLEISECGWGGMTVNPCDITVSDQSKLTITDCGDNGGKQGLGCYYGKMTIQGGSTVNVSENLGSDWGIFVKDLEVDKTSTLIANNNAGTSDGIDIGGTAVIQSGATVEASGNADAGLRIYKSGSWVGDVTIESGANVTMNGNNAAGISNNNLLTIKAGANVTITNNVVSGIRNNSDATANLNGNVTIQHNQYSGIYNNGGTVTMTAGSIMYNTTTGYGGGIHNGGTVTISDGVSIYNNHADTAGDDIYNRPNSSLSFTEVGSDWVLDDCNDLIDGWYDDSSSARWEAHNVPTHVEKFELGSYPVVGLTALKAAHGLNPIQPGDETGWETSKSKTATELDENYESQVTLSLPSAEEELVSDVVFVLDKSTSAEVENQAIQMLTDLNEQIANTGATVKVGVVVFNKEVTDDSVLGLTELNAENMPTIQNAIQYTVSGGTNTHAGLLAGKAMLDADTSVDANRKYLIFVSDAITYLFDDDGTTKSVVTRQYEANAGKVVTTDDMTYTGVAMKYPYGTNIFDQYRGVAGYLETIGQMIEADGEYYWVTYESQVTDATPTLKSNVNEAGSTVLDDETFAQYVGNDSVYNHANNLDIALYMTNQVYQSAVSAGYHCYALQAETNYSEDSYPWAEQFMNYLADGETVSFHDIQKDIYYLLDAGSTVEDYMGYVADDYNFDFVNDASKLSMKVGDTTYEAQQLDTNLYGFAPNSAGGYDYELTYVPGSKTSDEHFVWEINVPVSNFAPVQLTYSVQLVNPKTEPGTYGTYDADGSEKYAGLYTNNQAILTPVDSNGVAGLPEAFPKPTVSYTVNEPDPETGSLAISKTVNGTADTQILSEKFDFTVTFSDGGTYPYFFTQGSIESGTITSGETIQLTNGETVSINGIPDGVTYIVAETADEDFTTTVENSDGPALVTTYSEEMIQAQGTISGGIASIAHFVNTYTGEGPGTVSITPADITIYTGGDGYDSVVNGSGNEIGTTNNGLPTPGFYIELPHEVDQALKKAVGAPLDQPLDLSPYLTFTYNDGKETRTWHLERYDKKQGNDSMAYNRYIYRILPAEVNGKQIPVRLQFTDSEGNFMTSDDFAVNLNELFHKYDMTIYAGDLNQQLVQAVIRVNNGTPYQYDATVESGKLTVRGVTDNDTHYTTVEDSVPENVTSVTAQVGADAKFYINGSQLEVIDPNDVKLLVDSLVPDQNNTLVNSALDKFDAIPNDYDYEARYLDLVDTSNGNAYVTTDDAVVVYWAYPEGTDENTEFHLVHYVGLDRNSNDDLTSGTYTMEYYSEENGNLKTTEQGIRFTVNSFSPFALFWEDDSNNGGGGSSGGGGGGGGDSKPELNKEDHIAYVSGYPDGTVQPEGYITREEVATIFFRLLTDESRADFITDYNPYPDVASDRWSYYAITTMTNGNLMLGRTGGVFDPGANITRAEFAVVAAQFSNAQYSGPDKFTDISDHWARDYINRAANEGWIAGYPDGTFGPDRFITRAEVMALVNEVLERAPDADYMLDNMTVWPDNPKSAWYYEDVQEATNSHSYVWRNTQHTSEDWEDFISMRTFKELVRDAFNAAN